MSVETTNLEDRVEDIKQSNAFWLARPADCMSPDSLTSPGAEFLIRVRDAVLDQVEEITTGVHWEDEFHPIADNAVPIYTHDMWSTFVDLGAYQEEPRELGYDSSDDLTKLAQVALYMIAERLARSLGDDLREAYEADQGAGDDED